MKIEEFYDDVTGTFSYIVICTKSKKCAIIDPVANFDAKNEIISYEFSDKQIEFIKQNQLSLEWVLESHIHADHLSSANYLRTKVGGKIAISKNYHQIKDYWAKYFDIKIADNAFDHFLDDQEIIKIGEIEVKIISSPGHTPTCLCYLIEDNIFVGDLLLPPNIGCARCDFRGGSASQLYDSVMKIYKLDDDINVYICHDYPKIPGQQQSNHKLKQHKANNVMIPQQISREEFVKKRTEKDAKMANPKLLYPSIRANVNGGLA